MRLLGSFASTVLAMACLGSLAAACPSGHVQDPSGKCVSPSAAQQSTDDCAARGMVRRGEECVKPCPAGTIQSDKIGKCVSPSAAQQSTDDCAARGMVRRGEECVKPCPAGTIQSDKTGKCVSPSAAQQSTDDCAARGMVRRGEECVKPCPAGTIQSDKTGKCIRSWISVLGPSLPFIATHLVVGYWGETGRAAHVR